MKKMQPRKKMVLAVWLFILALIAGSIALVAPQTAEAQGAGGDGTRTWRVDNVRFDSGAVATGTFDYNPEPFNPLAGLYGTYSNINIDVTSLDGTVREFRSVNRASRGNAKYLSLVAAVDNSIDLSGTPFMALTPAEDMTSAGGSIDILPGPQNLSYLGTCRQANCGPADGPYEEALAGGRIVSGARTWRLDNVRFDSGAVATGTFDYDPEPFAPLAGLYGTYSNINIDVTSLDGTVREFRSVNRASRGNEKYLSLVAAVDNTIDLSGTPFMALTPAVEMTSAGGSIAILPGPANLSYLGTCRQANCGPADSPYEEALAGGRITTTPDTTPPLANATFDPVANEAGWYNSDVTITWNWTEPDGGIGIDPDNCERTRTFSGEGPQAAVGQCSDLAGNNGLEGSGTVNIDKTAPAANATFNPVANEAGWYNSDVTITWNWTSGIGSFECMLADEIMGTEQPCTSPQNYAGLANGVYTFSVITIDVAGNRDPSPATFSWTVAANGPPTITSPEAVSVPENQTAAIDVQATDSSDAEGSGLTFSFDGGSDDALFNIDANTGVVTFITAPDYENPVDIFGDNVYEIVVNVLDSSGSGSIQMITITVTDVDESSLDGDVLMVVGSVNDDGLAPFRDRKIVAELQSLGFTVRLVDDDVAAASDADGKVLVVVSSSVRASKIRNMFAATPVPVVTWEAYLFDNFGFTTGEKGETTTTQTHLTIVDDTHEISAGYGGDVKVVRQAERFSFAEPVDGAQIVAMVGARPVVFAFEVDTVAPARRVGLFMDYAAAGRLAKAGRHMFAAAVGWATNTPELVPNNAPNVHAGDDERVVSIGEVTLSLDAEVTDDGRPVPPGMLSTMWTSDDAELIFADPTQVDATVTLPGPGIYTLTLTADDTDLSASDTVTVTVVLPNNTAPVVSAGEDVSMALPTSTLLLDGSASDDAVPVPALLTTLWTQYSGPEGVTFDDPTNLQSLATFPGAGQYVLELTATDGELTSSDRVTINVDGEPPAAINVAYVASKLDLPSGDRPIRDRLVATGATVTVIDDDALLEDYSEFDLIWISTSVVHATVADHFATVAVPVITTEHQLFDDMSMASPRLASYSGADISIEAPGHELAASTTGAVTLTTEPTKLGYGTPSAAATIVATIHGNATYFAYETGDEMIDGVTAPARRVAFPGTFRTARVATNNYLTLLDAAVIYAIS